MFVFELEELAEVVNGKILTKCKSQKVLKFINHPYFPEPHCLYWMVNVVEEENKLVEQLKTKRVSAIVIKQNQVITIEIWDQAGIAVLEVPNSDTYFKLASYYRSQYNIPLIEVIGSSGKTTVKEMIGSILREKFSTLVGIENFNAPRGVAMNLFRLKPDHEVGVLEAGMSTFGHISLSSKMIKPKIGVVTSLQRAHISRLGSIENIIKAKSEIVPYLSEDGCLILNGENEHCLEFPISSYKGDISYFGFSNNFDIWASDIEIKDDWTYFKANTKTEGFLCKINTFGRYNVGNALASILVAMRLGMQPNEISRGLAKFKPPTSRLEIKKGPKEITIVNDNFNANPDSTEQLLEELPHFVKERPLILVMGDMENPNEKNFEYARKVHFEIGEKIGNMKFHRLIAIGKWAKEYVNGAFTQGISAEKLVYFSSVSQAKEEFLQHLLPESIVLFKASPYVQVKELIKLLK